MKIASAFIGDRRHELIYIMDEPTAALNGREADLLFAVIDRLRARGCALLYVTHRLGELFRIAQRVTVLRDGRVTSCRPIADTNAAQLIAEMTGIDQAPDHSDELTSRSDSPPRLQIRNLRAEAIYAASIDIAPGEIVGLAGLGWRGTVGIAGRHHGTEPYPCGKH